MKLGRLAVAACAATIFGSVSANAATLTVDTANAAGTTTFAALGAAFNPQPGPDSAVPPLSTLADPNLYIFDNTTQGFGLNVNIGAGEPGAVLTYTFRGYEAGFNNRSFELAGAQSFDNQNPATIGNSAQQVEPCSGSLSSCLAEFKFTSTHNGNTYEAVNGGVMETFGNNPPNPLRIAFAVVSSTQVFAFFDDGGANTDSDFDDMVLEITVRAATVEEIPLPAPVLLLLSGLLGLGFLGRFRQKKSAA